MSLEWREQLSVGNDLIDSDHKHLIEIINLADQSMRTKDRAKLTSALESLSRYSKAHFLTEEKIATAVGYAKTAELQASHEELLTKLEQLTQEINDGWSAPSIDHFIGFLREWLINHVIKEDMLLKPYLKKHSPRYDPR